MLSQEKYAATASAGLHAGTVQRCNSSAPLSQAIIMAMTTVMTLHSGQKRDGLIPQICKGDPRPRIPPRVMASSTMGVKLGGLWGFADHTWKSKRKTKRCGILHVFNFTVRPQ